jgi:hypothetical protein
MSDQHECKASERDLGGHDVHHGAHVVEKLDTPEAEKNSKGNADNIQPFGMMPVTPKLEALEIVHTAGFWVIKKELF